MERVKRFFRQRRLQIVVSVLLIVALLAATYVITNKKPEPRVSATVEYGTVRQLVSVSGVAEAKQQADLAFPLVGISKAITVEVGDYVEPGDILAILDTSALESDRQEALAGLTSAVADRGELISGPADPERTVTNETVRLKKNALATTKLIEESKIANARRTLLSSQLTAYTTDADENSVAPEVSGTYSCDTEGAYTLSMYKSDSPSGYSYRLEGLEAGSYTASVEQPIALGKCGLKLLFDPTSTYSGSVWHIDIPNKMSATYTINKNAYELAQVQASSAIALAGQEVTLAEVTADKSNATPRPEALVRADAQVAAAQARVNRVDASISDHIMRAPFAGTVTDISIKVGETATTEPIITLVASSEFEVTARIPEIDISKLMAGQKVDMVFDAQSNETVTGTVSFISLDATEIDGVSYFEAYMTLDNQPDWMRSGLNADIDIILSQESNTLRIPKRFLIKNNESFAVLKQTDDTFATTTIGVTLEGNDGFVAITGLSDGDTLVAP
jgi:HlyD family secretion protein